MCISDRGHLKYRAMERLGMLGIEKLAFKKADQFFRR